MTIRATQYDYENELRRAFRHKNPLLQHKVKFSAENASASIELAWRRGQHTGIYDAYRAIRKKYPDAAKALLDNFGMQPNGNIGIGVISQHATQPGEG